MRYMDGAKELMFLTTYHVLGGSFSLCDRAGITIPIKEVEVVQGHRKAQEGAELGFILALSGSAAPGHHF